MTVQLGDRVVDDLAEQINLVVADAEAAAASARRDEKVFRSLIADISHDLRTPLTAISGYQQVLAGSQLTAEQQAHLEVARQHTVELAALTEHFFEYAYLLQSDVDLDLTTFDLVACLGACLAGQVDELEDAGLSVDMTGANTLTVTSDEGRVRRVVHNLIRNACQHGTGVLVVDVQERPGHAVLGFRNGLPPGESPDVERVFERFYTGSRARASRTSGLGLAIVATLVEQLGGRARAGLEGDHLRITVELPQRAPEEGRGDAG